MILKKTFLFLISFFFLLNTSVHAMGDKPAEVKIGFNVPLTVSQPLMEIYDWGKISCGTGDTAGGINGTKIKLVVYDDQASPKESVPIAQKLFQKDKVVIVFLRAILAQQELLLGFSK